MISFQEDDYIRELQDNGETIWIAELSNGQSVYYDDGRPGYDISSSWIRLGLFLQENKLNILKLHLKFRSNRKLVVENSSGFFFSKQIFGGVGSRGKNFYLTGAVRNGIIEVTQWAVPELILTGSENREIVENPCLILNQQ